MGLSFMGDVVLEREKTGAFYWKNECDPECRRWPWGVTRRQEMFPDGSFHFPTKERGRIPAGLPAEGVVYPPEAA